MPLALKGQQVPKAQLVLMGLLAQRVPPGHWVLPVQQASVVQQVLPGLRVQQVFKGQLVP